MACAGVVVGTQSNGTVRRGAASDFRFTPKDTDLAPLIKGAKRLGEMFLEAGAEKVMPSTLHYEEYRTKSDLERLDHFRGHWTGISLNSAHPQGGNAICSDERRGVVDPDFLVRGTKNVYACDASVFPSSVTVNPQWTVMALAHYAAVKWFGRTPPSGPPAGVPTTPPQPAPAPAKPPLTDVRGPRIAETEPTEDQPAEPAEDQPKATDST
jgi:choline dehydrogenase-like flavoprotein